MAKWSDLYLQKWQSSDVAQEIDNIQKIYAKWATICVAILAGGVAIMLQKDEIINGLGLFVMLTGMVNFATLRLWAHIKLSMLRIIWQMQQTQ